MSMQDPIADMLVRIKNGQAAGKEEVLVPASSVKHDIATVLMKEGYIGDVSTLDIDNKPWIRLVLKYFRDKPVIETLKRVSRPGLRIYRGHNEIPKVLGGLGVAIISTPNGVMSDRQARKAKVGGEIICYIS